MKILTALRNEDRLQGTNTSFTLRDYTVHLMQPYSLFVLRIYYLRLWNESEKKYSLLIHCGFLVSNYFRIGSETYDHAMIHNLPNGIEFCFSNSTEELWMHLKKVLRVPDFCQPESSTSSITITTLVDNINRDLSYTFVLKNPWPQTIGRTNCLFFTRRMLHALGVGSLRTDRYIAYYSSVKDYAIFVCGSALDKMIDSNYGARAKMGSGNEKFSENDKEEDTQGYIHNCLDFSQLETYYDEFYRK